MAAVASAPGLPRLRYQLDSSPLSTIRDPRTPTSLEGPGGSPGSGASTPHHPDLNNEVATLSSKLVSAINHQTILDDALTAARQELETTHQQVRNLESDNMEFHRQLKEGELVTQADVDKIVDSFADDRRRAVEAEKEKKRMEQELETLTSSLFEQANEMVIDARRETESIDHKNQQLRMQLKDTEALLANHQEQLAELKSVLEQVNQAKAERDNGTNSTAPSTPAQPSHPDVRRAVEDMSISTAAGPDDVTPAPPTSFSYLLSPVLRTNLSNYDDFRSLMDIGKMSTPNSRVNSGTYNASNVPGLAALASVQPSAGSLPGFIHKNTSGSPQMSPTSAPLKETKFYKRALTEDIEPTLRLDTAPGLSWLVRRAVITSIVECTMVIEPMPSSNGAFVLPCSLCGEKRRGEEFARTHRFKTSEADSAQRYPLCTYCLNRMRATCDYISFLRMVKDGHWRTEGIEAEKSAWEESVRLRECMFWARIGGGVVPATTARDSPRPSTDGSKPSTPFSAPPLMHNASFDSQSDSLESGSQSKHMMIPEDTSRHGRSRLGSAQSSSLSMKTAKERSASVSPAPTGSTTPLKESLALKLRSSRQASYERERIHSPEADTLADATGRGRSSTSPSPARGVVTKTNDQGLHISIPNYSY